MQQYSLGPRSRSPNAGFGAAALASMVATRSHRLSGLQSHKRKQGMGLIERMTPVAGLRVLISGGASGIGEAMAAAFIEAKAEVHVCDVSEKALAAFRKRFPKALATPADVADRWAVDHVFAAHKARFGGLDVLINNAGIAGPTCGIDVIAESEWRGTVEVNLNAQYRFAHHAAPLLKKSEHG